MGRLSSQDGPAAGLWGKAERAPASDWAGRMETGHGHGKSRPGRVGGWASAERKQASGEGKNELGLRAKMREGEFVLFLFSSFISKPISNLFSKQFKSFFKF